MGATPFSYALARDDAGDAGRVTHLWTTVTDAGGVGRKKYTFETSTASAYFGLLTKLEGITLASGTVMTREDTTWTVDTRGRPYVGAVLSTVDVGTANEKQSKVEQTLDAYGNLTQRKAYE